MAAFGLRCGANGAQAHGFAIDLGDAEVCAEACRFPLTRAFRDNLHAQLIARSGRYLLSNQPQIIKLLRFECRAQMTDGDAQQPIPIAIVG